VIRKLLPETLKFGDQSRQPIDTIGLNGYPVHVDCKDLADYISLSRSEEALSARRETFSETDLLSTKLHVGAGSRPHQGQRE
jgi:hypothetical protein